MISYEKLRKRQNKAFFTLPLINLINVILAKAGIYFVTNIFKEGVDNNKISKKDD